MCLASVYSELDGKKTLIMSKVAGVETGTEVIVLRDFLGRTMEIRGAISMIDLENNIVLCKLNEN
ncbi:MAG: CooT family nickel-binding protein [Lachnospiraceae bacterium]|nr:CooT family nickel-binding protein [Lachnospiraceae bacterium]